MDEQKMPVAELKKIWTTKKQDDGTLMITSYKGNETDVVIPSIIGKNTVTALGEDVFKLNAPRLSAEQIRARKSIKSITVPGTIKEIPEQMCYSFELEGTFELERVVFEEGVEIINRNAFQRCIHLKEVVFPSSLKRIVGGAFVCCESLEVIDVPDGVEELGGFNGCKNLKKIHIPTGINTLTHYFFANLEIEDIEIPEHIIGLESHVFENCEKLRKITIPSTCKKFGDYCFSGCKVLEMPEIPQDAEIGKNAFDGCEKLTDENGFIVVNGIFNGYIPNDDSGVVEVPDYIKDFPVDFLEEKYSIVYRSSSETRKPCPNLSNIKVGDDFELGMFPRDESLELKPLEWKVLKIEEDKALVITKDSIMTLSRDEIQKRTWEECFVRTMLNSSFFETVFSEDERKVITSVKLDNPNNKKKKTPGGNPTEDKIFLLSIPEIEEVFSEEKERTAEITEYAKLQNYEKRDTVVFWMTRTPGFDGWGPSAISDYDGEIDYIGNRVGYKAVRPAMWVSLK